MRQSQVDKRASRTAPVQCVADHGMHKDASERRGRHFSSLTNKIIAAWHDDCYRGASDLSIVLGCSREVIYQVWKRAQKRGVLPSGRRDFYLANLKATIGGGYPHDFPITVCYRGGHDRLLRALQDEHGSDPLRAQDDMTERLTRIAMAASRGVEPGRFAA